MGQCKNPKRFGISSESPHSRKLHGSHTSVGSPHLHTFCYAQLLSRASGPCIRRSWFQPPALSKSERPGLRSCLLLPPSHQESLHQDLAQADRSDHHPAARPSLACRRSFARQPFRPFVIPPAASNSGPTAPTVPYDTPKPRRSSPSLRPRSPRSSLSRAA